MIPAPVGPRKTRVSDFHRGDVPGVPDPPGPASGPGSLSAVRLNILISFRDSPSGLGTSGKHVEIPKPV